MVVQRRSMSTENPKWKIVSFRKIVDEARTKLQSISFYTDIDKYDIYKCQMKNETENENFQYANASELECTSHVLGQ